MHSNRIESFRDLDAWKVAMDLTVVAYDLSKRLPASERFELSAQIRRAAVSVPANIAEGQACGKGGRYVSHVRLALGSLGELETHFEIARRLGFLSEADLGPLEEQVARTGKLLHGLLRNLLKQRAIQVGSASAVLAVLWLGHELLAIFG